MIAFLSACIFIAMVHENYGNNDIDGVILNFIGFFGVAMLFMFP